MIIRKKRMAHNGDIGSCSVADGYARNARPEPIWQIEWFRAVSDSKDSTWWPMTKMTIWSNVWPKNLWNLIKSSEWTHTRDSDLFYRLILFASHESNNTEHNKSGEHWSSAVYTRYYKRIPRYQRYRKCNIFRLDIRWKQRSDAHLCTTSTVQQTEPDSDPIHTCEHYYGIYYNCLTLSKRPILSHMRRRSVWPRRSIPDTPEQTNQWISDLKAFNYVYIKQWALIWWPIRQMTSICLSSHHQSNECHTLSLGLSAITWESLNLSSFGVK